jgi:hypothetical protein
MGGRSWWIGETTLAEIIKWGNEHALCNIIDLIRNPAESTFVKRVDAPQDGRVICEQTLNQGAMRKVLR